MESNNVHTSSLKEYVTSKLYPRSYPGYIFRYHTDQIQRMGQAPPSAPPCPTVATPMVHTEDIQNSIDQLCHRLGVCFIVAYSLFSEVIYRLEAFVNK